MEAPEPSYEKGGEDRGVKPRRISLELGNLVRKPVNNLLRVDGAATRFVRIGAAYAEMNLRHQLAKDVVVGSQDPVVRPDHNPRKLPAKLELSQLALVPLQERLALQLTNGNPPAPLRKVSGGGH